MNPKPRADSKLKTLPAERQAAIAEHARDHTLAETVKWLGDDGLKTSSAALSEFLSWYSLRAQLARNESTVDTLLAGLAKDHPDWDPEKIQTVGQSFFTALALQQQDPKQWFLIQQTQMKREQLALDKNKFEFDAAAACLKKLPELKAIATNKTLSEDEQIEQARLALFGSAPK